MHGEALVKLKEVNCRVVKQESESFVKLEFYCFFFFWFRISNSIDRFKILFYFFNTCAFVFATREQISDKGPNLDLNFTNKTK
jgi:hypothetical protein